MAFALILTAAAALAAAAASDADQAAPAAQAGAPAAQGVTSYPASFFAPSQPNTARDMIDKLPSFVFDDGSSVRGFAGAVGNVLIDGERPASKSDDVDSVLRRIPASQVERIDVIRGGAPGIDMQGKTVVANVIRKKASATTGLIAAAENYVPRDGRLLTTVRAEGTRSQGDKLLEGSLVVGQFFDDGAGDGWENAVRPDGTLVFRNRDNTQGGGVQGVATGAYTTPFLDGKLRLNSQVLLQDYIYDERDQNTASLSLPPTLTHLRQNQEQSELGLTYDRRFSQELSLQVLGIQQVQGEDTLSLFSQPGDDQDFRERHMNGETILRGTATYAFSRDLTFEAGGETDYNWLKSHTRFAVNGAPVVLPAADVLVTELRGEAFAKATWVISPRWTLEAGLRMEGSRIASTGDVVLAKTLYFPKPRAVLTWTPDPADQLRFRVEEEVGQLDFNDFVASTTAVTGRVNTGNPNLTPQQAFVLEAAYERRFWKSGDLSLTFRHSRLKDVVDLAPVISPSGVYDAPANIGNGREDDLIAALTLPIDGLGIKGGLIKANWTWRSSSVADPTTGRSREISIQKPREGEIDFEQDLPKWKLKWGGTYNAGWRKPYYRFNQVEIDSFRQFGTMFVEYRMRPGLSLRAELDDIGADFRRTFETYPDLRSRSALLYTDTQDLYFGPVLYLRFRQTL